MVSLFVLHSFILLMVLVHSTHLQAISDNRGKFVKLADRQLKLDITERVISFQDPEAKKPSQDEWDEREKIDDPEDSKPEDWDKPETIADPDATKPEDWDDEMDGEWEPPMIDNPDYKGEWKPRQIDNPEYKGKWVHPEIDNPEYNPEVNIQLKKKKYS